MKAKTIQVAGVSLYDSQPLLYLDDPKKLKAFVKTMNAVETYNAYPSKYVAYLQVCCSLTKAPYLGFIAKVMSFLSINCGANAASNPDIENIVLDFANNINALRERLNAEPTARHGFVRWYRVNDIGLLVVIQKLSNDELGMFIGLSKTEAITNKLWDSYFSTMQKAGV